MIDFTSFMWTIIAILEALFFVAFFIIYNFWFMPPIARTMTRIKWSKGTIAFIQHGNVVRVFSSDSLPDGILHNKLGWFLKSVHPYQKQMTKKRGRPLKNPHEQENAPTVAKEVEQQAVEIALRTPILEGLGRPVFFGSSDTPLLSNLETLAILTQSQPTHTGIRHAVLTAIRNVLPATYPFVQLDSLATWNYLRGLKMRGNEGTRWILAAIAGATIIAVTGIICYFIFKA